MDEQDSPGAAREVVATRGATLRLDRVLVGGEGEALEVVEITADSAVRALERYAPDQLDAAFLDLDRRFWAGEGAAHADAWRGGHAMLAAFSSRDLERFDAAFDPELLVVDHRPLGWAEVGLDGFRETFIAAYDMSPDVDWRMVRDLGSSPTMAYARIEMRGTREGGPFVSSFIGLIEVAGPVVTRVETFSVDDGAGAEARLAELSGR